MPTTPRRSKTGAASRPQINFARHARLCYICHHPNRDEIEQAFIDWVPAVDIRCDFQLEHRDSIYRHARAAGLFERRRRNVALALEHMIEKAGYIAVSAESVIHAIHALSRLDDTGRWNEVIQRVVVAKHSVFSHESQSSLQAKESRAAISTQGEIATQDLTPLEEKEPATRALPAIKEARETPDSAQSALFAKIEELTAKVEALCARTTAKEEANPPQPPEK